MKHPRKISTTNIIKSFLFMFAGLLLLAVRIPQFVDFQDFITFIGSVWIFGGILYFFYTVYFQRRLGFNREIIIRKPSDHSQPITIPFPKISLRGILLLIIIEGFLLNQFLIWRLNH